MNVGKWAIALILICLFAFSLITILSILKQDQSTDSIYVSDATSTINRTVNLTNTIIGSSTGFVNPLILIVAILFLLAVLLAFRKKW